MSLKKYTDEQYYAGYEGGDQPDNFDGLGSYQYIKLPALVDNFLLTMTGDGTVLGNVTKHAALFQAQRAVAELSYDVARPIKSFEYELVGSLALPLPKDYVSLTGVFVINSNGIKLALRERTESGNPTSPLQDEDGNYLYTASGDILENSNSSETEERFVENSRNNNTDELREYYGLGAFDAYDGFGQTGFSGRQFWLQPEFANYNGTYVLDDNKGLLTFDNKVADKIIVVDYVTDGLDEDINEIKIHKYLEDAVYMFMSSRIAKGRANVSPADKQLMDRDYAIAKRRGKHRLSKLNAKELIYTLRNRSKWIKT